jgi:hypothetical protein
LTNEPNKKGTIALKTTINKKGSLNVDGSLQVFPLDVAVKVETGHPADAGRALFWPVPQRFLDARPRLEQGRGDRQARYHRPEGGLQGSISRWAIWWWSTS